MPQPGRPASGSRLAQRRRAANLSQEKLAELTGISLSTITRMEAGSPANPKIRLLSNCALVLGCDIEDLIEPVWRKWAPLSPQATKQPSVKAVAEAQDASFKQAGGLPPAQNFPTPMSAEERRRREVLSGRAREREARKRRAREQGK